MNALVYNIYIVTVLEYVSQLLDVDDEVQDAVTRSLRRIAPGPGNWATREDLENLTVFGFPHEFQDIGCTARAAKLRIVNTIAPDSFKKCEELREAQQDNLHRPFGSWHNNSFYAILQRNKVSLHTQGVTIDKIKAAIRGRRGDTRQASEAASFQRLSYIAVKATLRPYNSEERLRKKIRKWRLPDPPAHVTCRILRNIAAVGRRCRPCVTAYMFRTIWNGWPTSARMEQKAKRCILGCSHAEDRLEHYLLCGKIWDVLIKPTPGWPGIDSAKRTLCHMMLGVRDSDEDSKILRAIAVYAIGRTVQAVRRSGSCGNIGATLKLFLYEGSKGAFHKTRGKTWDV